MKSIRRVTAVLMCVIFVMLSLSTTVAASSTQYTTNRYNIVFVNDESGSMTRSDDQQLRYEAIRRFVALMAQEGNRIGSVSFNERIIDSQEMTDVDSIDDKSEFVDHISQFSPKGNVGMTNIGLALQTAVELLDSGRNEELDSIIILLTDGETQLSSAKEEETSLEQKADAIEAARKAGYRIYSICLGGGAQEKEMKQISSATGGEFAVVEDAEDLDDVQLMYYKIIFNALSENGTEDEIGDDGTATATFTVPGIGVEELNIIIEGQISDCTLEDPNGKVYSSDEISELTMIGKDFRLIKVIAPEGGNWTATAYGEKGVVINFKPLYNSSFYINTSMSKSEKYEIGDTATFDAVICDKTGPITDTSRYDGFEGILHLSFRGEEKNIPMELGAEGFTCDYKIEEDGTYYAYITVNKDELTVQSEETYEFSVNNRAPIPAEDELTAHANIWPFFGGKAKLDLDEAVTDPDGDSITYSIDSTAFNEEDYSFEDGQLVVDNFSIKKGSFTIRATDSRGAYCTFDVLVTSTNIGLIMFIAICVGALCVLALIVFSIYRVSRNVFRGSVTVTLRNGVSDGASDTKESYELPRGSIAIEYWDVDVTEYLPKGTRVQAGGRKENCIYLKTKSPVCCGMKPGKKEKKFKIMDGDSMVFSTDADTSRGVRITYKADSAR